LNAIANPAAREPGPRVIFVRLGVGSAEYSDLVAEDEEFDVLG